MKKNKGLVWLVLALGAALAVGQTSNTLYVIQFPGVDVGTKVSAAMAQCNPNASVPCILVLDPALAVYPSGVMPQLCAQCSLADYRKGFPLAALTANVAAYPGATAAAKMNACLSSIGAGICDARGLAGTQVIDRTVTIGAGGVSQKLVLNPAAVYVPSGNPAVMFSQKANGGLEGLHVTISGSGYTGKVWDIEDTINSFNSFSASHVVIDASGASARVGTGLYMQPPAGGYIQLVNLSDVRIKGLGVELYLGASGTSGLTYINGVNFSDFVLDGWGAGLPLVINPDHVKTTEINSNLFANLQLEGTGVLLTMEGAGAIQGNVFAPVFMWDSGTPVSNTNTACSLTSASGACVNTFIGGASSSVTAAMDPFYGPDSSGRNHLNHYWLNNDNSGSVFNGGWFEYAVLGHAASSMPAFLGGWPSAGYWGCGPASAAADHTVLCGNAGINFTWSTSFASMPAIFEFPHLVTNGLTLGSSSTQLTRYAKYTATLSPVAVSANTCAAQSVTVSGVQASDIVLAAKKPTEQAGLALENARATGTNTVALQFCNNTSKAITPVAGESYTFVVVQ